MAAMFLPNDHIKDAAVALFTCQFVKPSDPVFSGPCKAVINETFKSSFWDLPETDDDLLELYFAYEEKFPVDKAWELKKIPDYDKDVVNYENVRLHFLNYLNTIKGAKKEEIETFTRFAGCFVYQSGIDTSRTAFNNCHDNEASA